MSNNIENENADLVKPKEEKCEEDDLDGNGDEDADADADDADDGDDGDDDDQVNIEGAYDPDEFSDLNVNPDVKNLFHYITSYTPQIIDLEIKLKPFIPDYIPAVGDIDPFIKIPRPDSVEDGLGLTVIDEPSSAKQSDPTLLSLKLRAMGKEVSKINDHLSSVNVARSVKDIDLWIENIRSLHQITASTANLSLAAATQRLPDIEKLMEEWDEEIEEALAQYQLPTADLDVTLDQYIAIICGLLDIPIYHSKLSSLHLLFNLYYEFQASQELTFSTNKLNYPPIMSADERSKLQRIKNVITTCPDFPKKGILFYDVLPIFASPSIRKDMYSIFAKKVLEMNSNIDYILGIESRGFLFGPSVADILNVPFVVIRKAGKLPGHVKKVSYALEYGEGSLEIQEKSLKPGSCCILTDDLLATGGTLEASVKLVESSGCEVVACLVIIELTNMEGRKKVSCPVYSMIQYNS